MIHPGLGTWGRRALWLAATTAVVAAVLAAFAIPAHAHASVIDSDPAHHQVLTEAPRSLTLTYNEPVTLVPDQVVLYDATATVVPSQARTEGARLIVDVDQELADGTYVLTWRIISADTHPVGGALTFSVGEPSPSVAPIGGSAEASTVGLSVWGFIGYLGLFLAIGTAIFTTWLLPRLSRFDEAARRIRQLTLAGSAVAVLAGLAGLQLTVGNQLGSSVGLVEAWRGASADLRWSLVLLALGLGAVTAGVMCRPHPARPLVGAGTVLATISPALTGHSRLELVSTAADAVHVLAGGVWLGGLIALAISLPAATSRAELAAQLLSRFSTVAAAVLSILVLTGLLLAWRIVPSPEALIDTGYGRLLLTKTGLVLIVVALAAWNRFVLLPRTRRATGSARVATTGTVRRTVAAEAAVLVGVLAVTGFLVNQPPAGREQPPLVQTAVLADQHPIELEVTPARTGSNRIRVRLLDPGGGRATVSPVLRVTKGDLNLGEIRLIHASGGGHLGDVIIPETGTWTFTVSARLDRFSEPAVTFEVEVGRRRG
ncbi:copper resistance CopC/CopD family protein [Nocardioides limicola]|uniref:copper resistance CopC/CopD family protein n=1 Tax=Nocardioides limicola TaxID=2803368 RepID=UPI00193B7185|nr:CopD family protein [Nocardioides sp. DJM-14]